MFSVKVKEYTSMISKSGKLPLLLAPIKMLHVSEQRKFDTHHQAMGIKALSTHKKPNSFSKEQEFTYHTTSFIRREFFRYRVCRIRGDRSVFLLRTRRRNL
jgi:hypothetical protein